MPSLYNLGLSLREAGEPGEAERCFRRVHEIAPADADALHHLGALLLERGSFPEAVAMFRRALQEVPRSATLWLLLGNAVKGSGDPQEAMTCFQHALEADPALAEAHNNIGNLLQDEGNLAQAERHYREAMRSAPGDPLASNNLGCLLARMGRLDEAADCLVSMIAAAPRHADGHFNLGTVRTLQGRADEAITCFRAALALRPDDAAIRECLLKELQSTCDWAQFDELCDLQRRAAVDPAQRVSPFSLLSIPSTPEEQLRCATAFASRYERAAGKIRDRLGLTFDRTQRSRLKVGYLSADFREHAVGHLIAQLIEVHDRRRFEIVGYSIGADDRSALRGRLVRAFDEFVDLQAHSHAEAAMRINRDRVDILVDLQGYTQGARTEIVALRPAPLQVNFTGYTGTMGARFIDYVVVDRFVAPPGMEQFFSEKLIRLPASFQVNDRTRTAGGTPARNALGLPEGGFVFCCFNQSYKILPEVFGVWMRLLRQVSGSVLWLLDTNRWARDNLAAEAARAGVDASRLVFAPFVPQSEHLGRMRAADLVLDTRPYNAHTTSSDALWVGVPVLTCPGETFASRVAGSLLHAVGAQDLIASTPAQYEALALRLARSPRELAEIRKKIEQNREAAPLFDTPSYARHLEQAFEVIWENHRTGNLPRAIEL